MPHNDGEEFYTGSFERCKRLFNQVDHKQWFAVINERTKRPVSRRFLEV
jgi:hypothetical protein